MAVRGHARYRQACDPLDAAAMCGYVLDPGGGAQPKAAAPSWPGFSGSPDASTGSGRVGRRSPGSRRHPEGNPRPAHGNPVSLISLISVQSTSSAESWR